MSLDVAGSLLDVSVAWSVAPWSISSHSVWTLACRWLGVWLEIMTGDDFHWRLEDRGTAGRADLSPDFLGDAASERDARMDFLQRALRTVQALVAEGMQDKDAAWARAATLLEQALEMGCEALEQGDAVAGHLPGADQSEIPEGKASPSRLRLVGAADGHSGQEGLGGDWAGSGDGIGRGSASGGPRVAAGALGNRHLQKEKGLLARLALETSRAAKGLSGLMGEHGRPDLALDVGLQATRLARRAVRDAKDAGEVFTILAAMLQRAWSRLRVAEELQLRLGQVDDALGRYDEAVDCLGRAAILAQSREFKELSELVEFPSTTVALDVAVTQSRMQAVAADLEWSRKNRPAQAIRRYDKAAATGLRGAATKVPTSAKLLKQQALEAAGSALAEGGRIVEDTVGLGGDTRRRYFLASKLLGQAARQASEAGRSLDAARLLVAASQAAYRSALSTPDDDDLASRSFQSASDLAKEAADILGAEGQQSAQAQALLAAGRILVVRGQQMERAGGDPEKVMACFREAVELARSRTLSGALSVELDRLAKDAEKAMTRTMARTGRWRRPVTTSKALVSGADDSSKDE